MNSQDFCFALNDSVLTSFAYLSLRLFSLQGTALSANGFVAVSVQLFVFPVLQRRLGTLRLFRSILLVVPVSFAMLPVLRWLTVQNIDAHGPSRGRSFALCGLIAILAIKSVTGMGMGMSPSSCGSQSLLNHVSGDTFGPS